MERRPRKPWRVTLLAEDATAVSDHTSEQKAYQFLCAALRDDSPADRGRVDRWEGGRWQLYETLTTEELA